MNNDSQYSLTINTTWKSFILIVIVVIIYYHEILSKLTIKSWLDNDGLRGNMAKLVTTITNIREINNCEVYLE